MTQEQKELLLKDLCARLPYGVVIQEKCVEQDKTFFPNKGGDRLVNIDAHTHGGLLMVNCGSWYYLDEIKPYLFPLSSMTEEQREELDKYFDIDSKSLIDGYKNGLRCPHPYFNVQDWYNKNHFDYRGLIPMGLANDATGLNIY